MIYIISYHHTIRFVNHARHLVILHPQMIFDDVIVYPTRPYEELVTRWGLQFLCVMKVHRRISIKFN